MQCVTYKQPDLLLISHYLTKELKFFLPKPMRLLRDGDQEWARHQVEQKRKKAVSQKLDTPGEAERQRNPQNQ